MTPWESAGMFAGGIGLFLLGMVMLTDGLTLAAGSLLKDILARFTKTRPRALASGVLVTGLVQSSTAVTVALIGFINAGLMTFGQALWVIFGSNVGTSVTGWLVALIGFKLKVEAFALPLIAVGMVLTLTGGAKRRAAVGTAVTGFGVLFLGINLLQSAFTDFSDRIDLPSGTSPLTIVYLVLFGILLTLVMQSSSAALAVTLTATQTGVLGLHGAAAVVIGSNIGTTATAALAALSATSNAKRTAAAHALFNTVTAVAALALLPVLIPALESLARTVFDDSSPAITLALFHTTFNVLGVLLMVPIAGRMAAWLETKFRTDGEAASKPMYLDKTSLPVPELAVAALTREVCRMGSIATTALTEALAAERTTKAVEHTQEALHALSSAVNTFTVELSQQQISTDTAERLAQVLRMKRCFDTLGYLLPSFTDWPPSLSREEPFIVQAKELMSAADPAVAMEADMAPHSVEPTDAAYRELRARLLRMGALQQVTVEEMEQALDVCSAVRRAVKKTVEAELLRVEDTLALAPEGANSE